MMARRLSPVEKFERLAFRLHRREAARARIKNRTHVVYRYFDADGALLYIGQTGDPDARREKHRVRSPWWAEVASFTVTRPTTRGAAYRYERLAIRAEQPRHNTVRFIWSTYTPRGYPF